MLTPRIFRSSFNVSINILSNMTSTSGNELFRTERELVALLHTIEPVSRAQVIEERHFVHGHAEQVWAWYPPVLMVSLVDTRHTLISSGSMPTVKLFWPIK